MSDIYQENDYYWYKKSDKDVYKSVFAFVKFLGNEQEYRSAQNLDYLRLYGNYDLLGLRQFTFNRESDSSVKNRVTMNIVQSMVDTVHSKITKNKPKPMFLTNGGDWSAQSKAKKLNKFIEGQFYAMNYYEVASRAFLDSLIFGTGCAKFYIKDGKICSERVFIDEIVIDDREALYGEPRQLHQKKWIHRDVLIAMFPDKKTAIQMATQRQETRDVGQYVTNSYNDMILVIESWKLPSSDKSKDGKHTICIDNETLWSEEYTENYFPFVFWRWTMRPLGFFGCGISEMLTGLQMEINKILRTIQVSMHLVSVPKIFMEASSKIISSHIDNKIGGIIKYVGNPPDSRALGNIPQELFAHLDRLYNRSFEIVGVSQLSAQSAKPSGLDSGKALRTFNDIESERFMANALRYEKTFLDAAKICINLAKKVASDNDGSFPVKYKTRRGSLELVDWKDVSLEEDQYIMQMFPTNALSSVPSARFSEVQELVQAGFVSMEEGMKLLDFPDVQGLYNFKNAPSEDIDRAIELIVDKQEYSSPEPYQNLQMGKERFTQAYLYYKAQGADEDTLELLRRWVSDAGELERRAMEEMQRREMAMQQEAMAQEQEAALSQQDAALQEQEMAVQQQGLAMEEEAMAQEQAMSTEDPLAQQPVPIG
jgi:hypothetical protein